MPRNIVDLSARSQIIRDEPWHMHFWESTPDEILSFLRDPRGQLARMGITIPDECRIETVIENHDWMSAQTQGLSASAGPIVVCSFGGGNVARDVYRVSMYAHAEDDVGKHEKKLLHDASEEVVPGTSAD